MNTKIVAKKTYPVYIYNQVIMDLKTVGLSQNVWFAHVSGVNC